jgi:23S rRNA G2445 N2-methylase RlmL
MAAHKSRGDIAQRVREPGFTPSVRDVPAIVVLLAGRDEDLIRAAERALVRLGPALVAEVRKEATSAPVAARARLVRAVGGVVSELQPESAADAVAWLIEELARGDAKGARYAATALGKARSHAAQAETALLAAWKKDPPVELRRALADALGKVGSEASAAALRALATDDPELKRLVGRALLRVDRSAARVESSIIDASASLDRPWPLVFRCREGLESVLVEELGDEVSPRAIEEGRVQAVLRGPLSGALAPRTATSFAFLVGPDTGRDEAGLVGGLLASDAAWRVFRTFTRGPIRFRLAFEGGGHRRGLVHRIAGYLREARPEVLNDPTGSPWEALVRVHHGLAAGHGETVSIELRPSALADDRFAYRISDVPAASHPTIAAALARVGGVRPDDVVWDPFVGSALELIERAKLGPYASLAGTDIEDSALEASRANLARAGVEGVRLTRADSTQNVPQGVTLLLTNPPMGRRVARGELAPLMDRFVQAASQAIVPGGRLAWLSPMPERTRGRLEEAGFVIDLARIVDIGGFTAELQRATKR